MLYAGDVGFDVACVGLEHYSAHLLSDEEYICELCTKTPEEHPYYMKQEKEKRSRRVAISRNETLERRRAFCPVVLTTPPLWMNAFDFVEDNVLRLSLEVRWSAWLLLALWIHRGLTGLGRRPASCGCRMASGSVAQRAVRVLYVS